MQRTRLALWAFASLGLFASACSHPAVPTDAQVDADAASVDVTGGDTGTDTASDIVSSDRVLVDSGTDAPSDSALDTLAPDTLTSDAAGDASVDAATDSYS